MARTWQAPCNPAHKNSRSRTTLRHAIHTVLAMAGPALFAAGMSGAQAYAVNDPITNPFTGDVETVLVVSADTPWVFTDRGHAIYVGPATVGATIADPNDPTNTLTISEVHVNETTQLVDYVLTGDTTTPKIEFVQTGDNSALPSPGGGDLPERDVELPPTPGGNSNLHKILRVGSRGRDGDNGYGIHLWFFTIGVDPENGSPGGTGPTLIVPIDEIDITSVSDALIQGQMSIPVPGVWVLSRGGDGGNGGDSYTLGSDNPGGLGGRAGQGGTVDVTSYATITSSGRLGHGMLVQSMAGSGGAGGDGFLFNSGAFGGPAAQGGSATATNFGVITTFGAGADGMLVQSLGGGGGPGGASYGVVGVSGGGNRGGNGGAATAGNDGTITTMGNAAHGMVAQSIGGSGGDAGAAGGIAAIGGSGAAGGEGGVVNAWNGEDGVITTGGDWSYGILAQSIGGGGGNGGTAGGIAGIGGDGGSGGHGDTVTVVNAGVVNTTGQREDASGVGSHGIVAQSIGGGGGTGGVGAGLAGLGGSAISGDNWGGTVFVQNQADASVYTAGTGAYGILAQSIGGGGGTGATGGGVVGIGGEAGAGGAGGVVVVTNAGTVTTMGSDAKGIVAQSIGGGGGAAHGSGGLVSIGGKGGSGGASGTVTVANDGWIFAGSEGTAGSDGILAQSIGGGGGAGGSAGGLVALGGSGTGVTGGNGGVVSVANSGGIDVQGNLARGIHAQSIGGGGGSGGNSGGLVSLGGTGSAAGAGQLVTVINAGSIKTDGRQSSAIEAQSIGGGGGSGGTSGGAFLTIGGGGGTGSNGGVVALTNSGEIETLGDDSHGILAQSIGGGGGNGGNSVSASAFVGVGIGGKGAGGGAGGLVTVEAQQRTVEVGGVPTQVDPYIHTTGDRSKGILAQSVGGGGGNGGFSVQGTVGYVGSVSVSIGGQGGKGGDGGEVKILGDSTIRTEGVDADGIVAQSVGGGGGSGGFSVSFSGAAGDTVGIAVGVSVAGDAGSGGKGKDVTLDAGGNIHTLGDQSEGIVAQSIGGSGGTGGFSVAVTAAGGGTAAGSVSVGVGGLGGAGGDAGTVNATWHGNVRTEGDDANAMLLQGVGGGGGNGGFNVSAAVSGAGSASGAVAVGVGGSGGLAGRGGIVTANVQGDIATLGDRSSGLVAQSVGGRGGNGGFNVSGSITGSGGASGAVSVGIGGSGGGGGNANVVDASFTGNATTSGDDADAILFQSVGGSGGNGAFNVSGGIAASTKGAVGVSVGVGGSGGGAGSGDLVKARVDGALDTSGARSNAFIAQSIGGGGGNGGFNVSGVIEASAGIGGAIAVGVGGSGGAGGDGGVVDAIVKGTAITRGLDATAIIAQSIGGGGGTGGFNVSGAIAANKDPGGTVGVGVGGAGGAGGDGREVGLAVTGQVVTEGDNSGGVLAQSLGGGGGAGGMNVTGGVSASTSAKGSIGVGIGGSGGSGGDSATVTASHVGSIQTAGHDANAFTAQSIGGGGGSGGLNVTGGVAASLKEGSGALAVGVGGSGGSGGAGGQVVGTLDGSALTFGDRSIGVLLQSVGGGGGAGGLNVSGTVNLSKGLGGSIAVGVGGSGGTGGAASAVTGTVNGTVATAGDGATGVLVQSVGGGGGAGGINVSGAIGLSADSGAAAAIGVGGFGAGGGDGGTVSLMREGVTATDGANADAVVVQSIGGGGGAGGINVSGGVSASGKKDAISVTFGLGGFGGAGGDADKVTAHVAGDVYATGLEADRWVTEDGITRRERVNGSNAIVAQSLGGSGGNGATNVSGGVSLTGSSTSGKAMGLNIGVGGFGGAGGDAGEVELTVDADHVVAIGDQRSGVIAQSIGGGGGNGGANISAGIVMNGQITLGVGGFGGDGGLGKKVDATVAADVAVAGEGAIGFLAQSIGGGGGNGGFNVSGGVRPTGDKSANSLVFGLGGFGGDGNRSGEVVARQAGDIVAEGVGAIGVLAQSIAGGGGNGGLNISGNLNSGSGYTIAAGVGGSGGAGANAGNVTLTSDGTIVVDGGLATPPGADYTPEERAELDFRERANGILAQSVGGGGGNGGFNLTGVVTKTGSPIDLGVGGTGGGGGDAGTVTVLRGTNAESVLVTKGDHANGLTAQSIGGGGGNAGGNLVLEARLEDKEKTEGYELIVAIGGAGGDPGHGNTVTVTNVGDIQTDGRQSDGILAQSVGGGGGNAAFNMSFAYAQGAKGLNVALGGAAGDGGDGKQVTVDHRGTIVTAGDGSSAIFAQSVGGGGGNAETNAITTFETSGSLDVKLGREGGTGGKGGDVTVVSDGALRTEGNRAVGLFAQSVGNGGGTSGAIEVGFEFEKKGKESKDDATDVAFEVQVGLEGGEGGTAGNVEVTASGSITTLGLESHAIQAQSVGGGGGVGGSAGSKIAEDGVAVSVGVGGRGGTGAVSGTVDVDNAAMLVTEGAGAHGIFAQSVGGGGGVGGNSGTTSLNISPDAAKGSNTSINVSVGGEGGIGAEANTVTVTNTGSILTSGDKAYGINAQSTGGGGGTGGAVIDEVLARGKNIIAVTVDVGGFGGQGGDGKTVTVTNTGVVHTLGDESIGIRAQSLGGGGGDGGLVANLRAAPVGGSSTQTTLLVNYGGEGGTGGAGGTVVVRNARRAGGSGGIVLTEGAHAHGIFAQSLGGGGGNGSSIVSANVSGGAGSTLVGINIGGTGGTGGEGGHVEVANQATIETHGLDAHGVFAQSTGGGGGNGGLTLAVGAVIGSGTADRTPIVALGGIGGDGGNAGDVLIENTGDIVTHGDRSHGIYAQTMGGGGGNAGVGLGFTSGAMTTRIAGALSATFGGLGGLGVTGGEGGKAGSSTVVQHGDVVVLGRNSRAVVVENVNGGGGHISLDFSGITSFDPEELIPDVWDLLELSTPATAAATEPSAAVPTKVSAPAFEFRGGATITRNSSAGQVALDYTGDFGAAGDDGAGNSAQAVGGGGGAVDLNLGLVSNATGRDQRTTLQGTLGGLRGRDNDGGAIASRHVGDVRTEGANTLGVFLQSVGGGGGRANVAVSAEAGTLGTASFDLGGTNGTRERGADVTHEQRGSVETTGDAAHAVVLQSIGGGGGALSYRVEASEAGSSATDAVPGAFVSLGSHGGGTLDGLGARLELDGDATTHGDQAVGIVVQSIGAGGGAATVLGVERLGAVLGGDASAKGSAASVEVVHRGDVATSGARAHGVVLQSIGGGGGAVFTDAMDVTAQSSGGSAGDGGEIVYTQQGDVVATGDGAYGIVAQSLGGGGGFVDGGLHGSAGGAGRGGAITLDLAGNVGALGAGGTALFVQSAGRDGAADIHLALGEGLGIVGGLDGTAVHIDGGADNTFVNAGTVGTLSGATGMAIKAGAGDDAITNRGTLLGNVDLGGGSNRLDNEPGAAFYTGTTVDLGSPDALLTQRGLWAPGAGGLAVTTALDGSFAQTATGLAELELDFAAGAADSLAASGTVTMDGTARISLLNVRAVRPGTQQLTLFSGEGGLVDDGLVLETPASIVIGYELLHPTENSAALEYAVDFAPDGLVGNRVDIGEYINRVQAAGSATALATTIESLVAQTELAPYATQLTQLGPEFHAEQQALTLGSVQRFTRVMRDCGSLTYAGGGDDCVWMRFDVDASSRDAAQGFPATYETARRYSAGRQKIADDGWTWGLGANFEHNDSAGFDGRWRGETTTFQVGLQARKRYGSTSVVGALLAGNAEHFVQRRPDDLDGRLTSGNRDVPFVGGVVGVERDYDVGPVRVTPELSLGAAWLDGEHMREHGGNGQTLEVEGRDETSAWVEPAIAAGFDTALGQDKTLRIYARLGALQYLTDATTEVRAGFVAAPAGVTPMTVGSDLDDLHWLAEGGLELVAKDRYTISVSYGAQRSDLRDSDTGTIRLVVPLH
jgi:hypothetical protein